MPKTTYMWDELSDNVAAEYEDGVLPASYTHEPGLYGNLLSQNRNGELPCLVIGPWYTDVADWRVEGVRPR